MSLSWVALGLLGALGLAAFGIELALRSHEGDPGRPSSERHAELVPLGPDDLDWFGAYRLFAHEEIQINANGSYHERCRGLSDCFFDQNEHVGRWERKGSTLRLAPDDRTPSRELMLGRLDGELVLLGEYSVWRRVL